MDQKREQVVTNILKASNIFDEIYSSFESKVDLIRNVYNNSDYAKQCTNSSQIYEAIHILGDNAVEEIPRRLQQQYLAQLMKVVMSNPDYDTLMKFFNDNPILFNAFCLMFIHFQDEAISEKEKKAHEFMTGHISNCVQKIISK